MCVGWDLMHTESGIYAKMFYDSFSSRLFCWEVHFYNHVPVDVRGQHLGVRSLPPPCGTQELNFSWSGSATCTFTHWAIFQFLFCTFLNPEAHRHPNYVRKCLHVFECLILIVKGFHLINTHLLLLKLTHLPIRLNEVLQKNCNKEN